MTLNVFFDQGLELNSFLLPRPTLGKVNPAHIFETTKWTLVGGRCLTYFDVNEVCAGLMFSPCNVTLEGLCNTIFSRQRLETWLHWLDLCLSCTTSLPKVHCFNIPWSNYLTSLISNTTCITLPFLHYQLLHLNNLSYFPPSFHWHLKDLVGRLCSQFGRQLMCNDMKQ